MTYAVSIHWVFLFD